MKRNSAAIIFLLVHIVAGAQSNTDSICWCREFNVKWFDFQGIPREQANWKAVSSNIY